MRPLAYTESAILTADGCIESVESIGVLADEGCCPPSPCQLDACTMMCNYINLLPNGPMWDRAKVQALEKYSVSWCAPDPRCESNICGSLVDYAAYSGYRLFNAIQGPLWTALREASPYTAVETIPSWLQMYGWENPWETICRDPRLSPSALDCTGEPTIDICDTGYTPVYVPTIPAELDKAVQRGVAIALSRLEMSPIKNLCGINWVIEPLSAVLRPKVGASAPCTGAQLQLEICNAGDTIEAAPTAACSQGPLQQIPAWFEMQNLRYSPITGVCAPTGFGTTRIWPAVMAAEYIALSMLPPKFCKTPITRCVPTPE